MSDPLAHGRRVLRVVFMGTPDFAVPALEKLIAHHDVVAVYSRPDAPSGRGGGLRPTPVKVVAEKAGIPVLQPKTLRDPEAIAELASFAPDVIVVAAFGMILPNEVFDIAPLGCINIHASILPRWRGAAPIQRAILAGDEYVGVSIMRVEEELDAGDYCKIVSIPVGDDDAVSLTSKLAEAGAVALVDALDELSAGTVVWTSQDEAAVTYAPKIAKSETALSPELSAQLNVRRVRASSPQAPARLLVSDRGAIALEVRHLTEETRISPGEAIATREGLVLGAADAAFLVTRIKPDGKGAMSAADWARGLHADTLTWKAAL